MRSWNRQRNERLHKLNAEMILGSSEAQWRAEWLTPGAKSDLDARNPNIVNKFLTSKKRPLRPIIVTPVLKNSKNT